MPKLFLNKTNDTFLQEIKTSTTALETNTIVQRALEKLMLQNPDKIFIANTFLLLSSLIDKNKKLLSYMYNDSYTTTSNRYYSYRSEKILKISFINTVVEKSTSEINLGTPTASAKNYYGLVHNQLDTLREDLEKTISFIEPTQLYPFDNSQNQYQGKGIIVSLQSVQQALLDIALPQIDMKKYTLREFKPQSSNIEKKELFYLVHEESFLTLSKGRKAHPTFHWGLTKNIGAAFLFNGDLSTYALPFAEKDLNKIFVEVSVKSVEKNVKSKVTDELEIRIENRDIKELLHSTPEANKPIRKINKL